MCQGVAVRLRKLRWIRKKLKTNHQQRQQQYVQNEDEDENEQHLDVIKRTRHFLKRLRFYCKLDENLAEYAYITSVLDTMNGITLIRQIPIYQDKDEHSRLTQLMKTIERIKVNLNPDLEIQGILLTMYDRRNKLSSQVEQEARDYFKEKVYQTVIPRNVRLSEAPSHGVPVLIYDKNCPGSKSYYNFTDEFMSQEKNVGSAA